MVGRDDVSDVRAARPGSNPGRDDTIVQEADT